MYSTRRYREPFMNVIMWVLMAVAGLLAAWLVFYFVDSSFLPTNRHDATVIKTSHTAGHFQTVTSGKTTTMIWIDDSWGASVKTAEGLRPSGCEISERVFDQMARGDAVSVQLVTGRISGSSYCKGLSQG